MKITIVLPVYNEEKTVLETLNKIIKSKAGDIKKEIIIVDDGSTDNTREILKSMSKKKFDKKIEIKFLRHSVNMGKGSAIKTALMSTTGDLILIQDADLELDPGEYEKLLSPILNNKAPVVYGSRFGKYFYLGFFKYRFLSWFANTILTLTANILFGAKITDEATGFKVFKTEVLKSLDLQAKQFEFCPEVTAKLCKRGYKIEDVLVSFNPRDYTRGKKIKWKDGFIALWTLLKYRFID